MNHPTNPFKCALAEERTLFGVWCALGTAPTVELLGHSGFDWLLIDMEHGPTDIAGLRDQLIALNGSATVPIVRAKWNDMVEIKRLLDVGAQTLMIPHVQDAAEAHRAVRHTRYPPQGVRGVATLTRAAGYGRRRDYLLHAAEGLCVLIQVESRLALDNLPSILSVEGVDGIFIGPADLAASLGHLGNPSHPEVQSAIEGAVELIRSAGKKVGTIATEFVAARRTIELGFDFIAVGIDAGLLAQAADGLAARFIQSR